MIDGEFFYHLLLDFEYYLSYIMNIRYETLVYPDYMLCGHSCGSSFLCPIAERSVYE